MTRSFLKHLEYLLCIQITGVKTLGGGDISKAFLIETEMEQFFCKMQQGREASELFEAEKFGLQTLASTHTLSIPRVLYCSTFENNAFLILEFISQKQPITLDFEALGHQLAQMHLKSQSESFGLGSDNYIGSLKQSNDPSDDWSSFFVSKRLMPQLQLALENGFMNLNEIPEETMLLTRCENLFPVVKPSLLHGDLWSGNFLISEEGEPFLIDPSIYYGHHEVDLAMTQLFGGFELRFYEAYHEVIPSEQGERERLEIYQLYYLLVHLNLFGNSYHQSVTQILERYFS